ncbi:MULTISPECIES: undecaprenyl-diphosphatase [unclassified Afipia]|uniref:undecaprenyl-diphosphatase n=1 Tax=unclassified Afipia TaxID=2642050 RepID=UPI0004B65F5C|nr:MULTISPECIES: undecaprenyl-diphosphatase [unclassified Afipia]
MFEAFNMRLFEAIAAAPTLAGAPLAFATLLAQSAIYLVPLMLVLLWIFGAHAERRAAVDGGLSTLLALALAVVISSLWMHPRPFAVLQIRNFLKHAADSSFPSDHSTVLFALGFALWASGSVPGRSAGALAVVLGISVGWARVYLAAHYPLDIVGAAGVAAISSWAVVSPIGRTISARLTIWGEHLFGWSIASNLRRRR